MKDNTIRVGDLVMIVRPTPCCGTEDVIGPRIFIVSHVETTSTHCAHCLHDKGVQTIVYGNGVYPADRLRLIRIDPPAITQDTLEEITA